MLVGARGFNVLQLLPKDATQRVRLPAHGAGRSPRNRLAVERCEAGQHIRVGRWAAGPLGRSSIAQASFPGCRPAMWAPYAESMPRKRRTRGTRGASRSCTRVATYALIASSRSPVCFDRNSTALAECAGARRSHPQCVWGRRHGRSGRRTRGEGWQAAGEAREVLRQRVGEVDHLREPVPSAPHSGRVWEGRAR